MAPTYILKVFQCKVRFKISMRSCPGGEGLYQQHNLRVQSTPKMQKYAQGFCASIFLAVIQFFGGPKLVELDTVGVTGNTLNPALVH